MLNSHLMLILACLEGSFIIDTYYIEKNGEYLERGYDTALARIDNVENLASAFAKLHGFKSADEIIGYSLSLIHI